MWNLLSIFKTKKIMEAGQENAQDQTPKETPKDETTNITITTIPSQEGQVDLGNTNVSVVSVAAVVEDSIKITSSYNDKLKEALKKWKIEAPEFGHVRAVPVEDAHIEYIIKALGLV